MYKTSYAFFSFPALKRDSMSFLFLFFSVCDIFVFRESDRSLGKPRNVGSASFLLLVLEFGLGHC